MGKHLFQNIRALVLLSLFLLSGVAHAGLFMGVGATFPKEVYQEWGKQFKEQTGTILAYFPRGSGKGVDSISANMSDFGASDKPLSLQDLEKKQLMQFPALIGGIIPIANLKIAEEKRLQLDGPTLAAIYMGKITRWDDPAIVALNPGVKLPSDRIVVLHRAERSGSTFVLSDYLSKVSPEWKEKMGSSTHLKWLTGEGIEGSNNLADRFQATPGAIAYLDPGLVLKLKLGTVKLRNRDGHFVNPGAQSFSAAAANAKWQYANGYTQPLTDMPGAESWPITTATYIILMRSPSEVYSVSDALKFFDWAFRNGSATANQLGFVMLPPEAMQDVRQAWKEQIKGPTGQAVWR